MPAFDLERILAETFVRRIEFHDEIGSTNSRALELAAESSSFPVLVLADRQTSGRGRGSHHWWAGRGGLTLSLLFDSRTTGVSCDRWPWISLTSGLAVAEAITPLSPTGDVRLKWPNDVYLNCRKVCGILVESISTSQGAIVIGIGLNVNNSMAQAPPELQAIATSLIDTNAQALDRTSVAIAILRQLECHLAQVRGDLCELAERWRERCYLQGRTIQVQFRQDPLGPSHGYPHQVTGVCQGINDDGALLVQTETDLVRCFGGTVTKIL